MSTKKILVIHTSKCKEYVSGMAIACSAAIRKDNKYGAKIKEGNAVKMDFAVFDIEGNECAKTGNDQCSLCTAKQVLLNPSEWTPIGTEADAVSWTTFGNIAGPIKNRATGKFRVMVDDELWIEPYIKNVAVSTLVRSKSPSGKGRISVGGFLALQGQSNANLVMVIKKDPRYNDAQVESKEPVVNAVGFRGLDKSDKKDYTTEYIIQLHENHMEHTCFGFYRRTDAQNIRSISVDLVAGDQPPKNLFVCALAAPLSTSSMPSLSDDDGHAGGSPRDSVINSGYHQSDGGTSPAVALHENGDRQPPSSETNWSEMQHDVRQFQPEGPLNGYRMEMQQRQNDRRNNRRHDAVNNRAHIAASVHHDNRTSNSNYQAQLSMPPINRTDPLADQQAVFRNQLAAFDRQQAFFRARQAQLIQLNHHLAQAAQLIDGMSYNYHFDLDPAAEQDLYQQPGGVHNDQQQTVCAEAAPERDASHAWFEQRAEMQHPRGSPSLAQAAQPPSPSEMTIDEFLPLPEYFAMPNSAFNNRVGSRTFEQYGQ